MGTLGFIWAGLMEIQVIPYPEFHYIMKVCGDLNGKPLKTLLYSSIHFPQSIFSSHVQFEILTYLVHMLKPGVNLGHFSRGGCWRSHKGGGGHFTKC